MSCAPPSSHALLRSLLVDRVHRASYEIDSRASLESNTIYSASSVSPRPAQEMSFDSSEYSPSIASVRHAVVRARPLEALSPAEAFKASVQSQSGFRTHTKSPSVASLPTDEDETQQLHFLTSTLMPGPKPGQRMQSFLAPKMTILSPAPWTNDFEAGRRNSSPHLTPPTTFEKAIKGKISAPAWSNRSVKPDTTILDSFVSRPSSHTEPRPSMSSGKASTYTQHDKENVDPRPHKKSPTKAKISGLPSLPSDASLNSKHASTPITPEQALSGNARLGGSGQTLRLISLDAARSLDRERQAIALANRPVDALDNHPKQLRNKKSGFLKIFKKDEAPPLPNDPSAHRSTSLNVQVPPHSLSLPGPLSAPATVSSRIAFAPTPTTNPNDRINARKDGLGVPKVNLRPISMAFSAGFSDFMEDCPSMDRSLTSPSASSTSMSTRTPSDLDSILTTPTTPGFLGSPTDVKMLSPEPYRNASTWMQQQQDYMAQVGRLEAEIDNLRRERDSLLDRSCGRFCDKCGCGSQRATSVLSRPRVLPADSSSTLFTALQL